MAEAVAEVLARFAPNGVAIESTGVAAKLDNSEGHAVGPLRVAAYLRMNDQIEETRRKLEEALWYLGRIRHLPPAQFRPVQDTDWSQAWKQHYRPIAIGSKLMIVPAWLESPDPSRIPVRIDPGMAFGTGTHPTTQLCLELTEAFIDSYPGKPEDIRLIDIGCGSGILSVAALKLGAGRALGVDIDPDSVNASRENAETNGVLERFEIGQGSLAEVLEGKFSFRQGQLVLANILAVVIVRLLDEGLGKLLVPDGALILSGIIDTQEMDVLEAAERNSLRLTDRRQIGDWVALTIQQ